jgi:hypothetical protein
MPAEARRTGPSDPRVILGRWRRDRMAFRREAIVLEDGRPFGDVIEDWQVEDFACPSHLLRPSRQH